MCGPLTSKRLYARMAELEDAYDLGSYVSRRVGSSPTLGTITPRNKKGVLGGKMRGRTIEVLYTDLLFQLPPIGSDNR